MEETKKMDDLDEIRKKMPDKYQKWIAEDIAEEEIDTETVRRVFRKQNKKADVVLKVLTSAKKLLETVKEEQQQISDLQKDIATMLA